MRLAIRMKLLLFSKRWPQKTHHPSFQKFQMTPRIRTRRAADIRERSQNVVVLWEQGLLSKNASFMPDIRLRQKVRQTRGGRGREVLGTRRATKKRNFMFCLYRIQFFIDTVQPAGVDAMLWQSLDCGLRYGHSPAPSSSFPHTMAPPWHPEIGHVIQTDNLWIFRRC